MPPPLLLLQDISIRGANIAEIFAPLGFPITS
jgi:hypothetical protein